MMMMMMMMMIDFKSQRLLYVLPDLSL